MANFASLHGPVGLNRVYVQVPDGPLTAETWLESLRQGKTFATNAPLLQFTLGGQGIGGDLRLPAGRHEVAFTASLRSLVPIDHLEVVCNSKVARRLELGGGREQSEARGTLTINQSGWCLLRAWNEKPHPAILDIYPYGTTSPIYITVGETPARSAEDAAFFTAWIDRILQEVHKHTSWNTEAEKEQVLERLSKARAIYEDRK